MNGAELKSEKFKLSKKLNDLQHGYTDGIDGLNVKELEANLLTYAKHQEEVGMALKNSKEIKDKKEELKELQGPYQDSLKAIKLKMGYIHLLIKEKNGDVSEEAEETKEA